MKAWFASLADGRSRFSAAAWPWMVAAFAMAPGLPATAAESRLAFQALPESRVQITGSTNLGRWECDTQEILAVIEPGRQLEALSRLVQSGGEAMVSPPGCASRELDTRGLEPPHALITIPVQSLRAHQLGMRNEMRRSLRMEDAPLIVFLLSGISAVRIEPREAAELGRYQVAARGDLSLGGGTRTIEITAQVVQEGPNRFRVRARQPLRMSDFAIAPPTALFGLIRSADEIVVEFDLVFEARGPAR